MHQILVIFQLVWMLCFFLLGIQSAPGLHDVFTNRGLVNHVVVQGSVVGALKNAVENLKDMEELKGRLSKEALTALQDMRAMFKTLGKSPSKINFDTKLDVYRWMTRKFFMHQDLWNEMREVSTTENSVDVKDELLGLINTLWTVEGQNGAEMIQTIFGKPGDEWFKDLKKKEKAFSNMTSEQMKRFEKAQITVANLIDFRKFETELKKEKDNLNELITRLYLNDGDDRGDMLNAALRMLQEKTFETLFGYVKE